MIRLAQKSYPPPHEILSIMALQLILQPTTQGSSVNLPMKGVRVAPIARNSSELRPAKQDGYRQERKN